MLAILAPILVFGLVIFVHELGHFIAAKSVGVYAPRFSIGFGPSLFRKRWGETEYILAALPLGGYVRMASRLDEDAAFLEGGSERAPQLENPDYDPNAMIPFGPVPIPENRLFESKPLPARLFILIAGVTMNVLLTFVIAIGIALHYGNPVITTRVIGQVRPLPNAPAFEQLQAGDTILAVNGSPVRNWEDVARDIVASKDSVVFRTSRITVHQPLGAGGAGAPSPEQIISSLDFERPAVLDAILPGGRADQAGLQSGDSIVAIDGRPVSTWGQLVGVVSASPDRTLRLTVVREHRTLDVTVMPKPTPDTLPATQEIRTVGKIGASSRIPTSREPMSVGAAVSAGSRMTLFMAGAIVDIVKKLVTREISVSQLSGPVGITRMSVEAARSGLESLLTLIALLSVNVAILNMLPIPILDGGQILINVLESAKGKPFSLRTREYILRFGLLAIALLFVVVMYNDTHGFFARLANWFGRLRG
ncbi:MAG TPA: RIP metalloprotease RseP [Gemmatimonadaceae bacterium]|nr:RIP metalloprotease RseP [Gemmatimonadaceae bacterium]